jgi:hypothetical protein
MATKFQTYNIEEIKKALLTNDTTQTMKLYNVVDKEFNASMHYVMKIIAEGEKIVHPKIIAIETYEQANEFTLQHLGITLDEFVKSME